MAVVYHSMDVLLKRRGGRSYSPNPFIVGSTKPTESTVGVPVGRVLTPLYGDQVITTPYTVFENRDIYGFLKVRAAHVTVRNCIVRGSGPGSTNTALIDCNHVDALDVLVEDCLLVPDTPSYWLNGMIGHDYTVRRTETYNVVDGFGVYNAYATENPANVLIEGCYVHDLAYFSPDPNHDDNRTHNDCIQIQGNGNIQIRGCNLLANVSLTAGTGSNMSVPAPNPYYPSVTGQGIGITPNVSQVVDLTIDSNWIDYGAQSITAIPGKFAPNNIGTITNNKFGRNQPNLLKEGSTARRPILIDPVVIVPGLPSSTGTDTISGNVYEDNSNPITVWRHAA